MALTTIEQMEIANGQVGPPSVKLVDLVQHVSFMYAKNFMDNFKSFDTVDNTQTPPVQINEEAGNYRGNMISYANVVFSNRRETAVVLSRIVVVILGEQAFTAAQIAGADDDAWATFVFDQMDEAFEYASGANKDFKAAYDLMP